jgi:hypothetical protein
MTSFDVQAHPFNRAPPHAVQTEDSSEAYSSQASEFSIKTEGEKWCDCALYEVFLSCGADGVGGTYVLGGGMRWIPVTGAID